MIKSLLVAIGAVGVAFLALELPMLLQLPAIIIIQLAAIWVSARVSLPYEDRKTLGKTARKLRLV
jgi:uncharacterized membrane protein YesL